MAPACSSDADTAEGDGEVEVAAASAAAPRLFAFDSADEIAFASPLVAAVSPTAATSATPPPTPTSATTINSTHSITTARSSRSKNRRKKRIAAAASHTPMSAAALTTAPAASTPSARAVSRRPALGLSLAQPPPSSAHTGNPDVSGSNQATKDSDRNAIDSVLEEAPAQTGDANHADTVKGPPVNHTRLHGQEPPIARPTTDSNTANDEGMRSNMRSQPWPSQSTHPAVSAPQTPRIAALAGLGSVPMAITISSSSTASSSATTTATTAAAPSPGLSAIEAAAGFVDSLHLSDPSIDLLVSEHDQVLDIHNFAASDADVVTSDSTPTVVIDTSGLYGDIGEAISCGVDANSTLARGAAAAQAMALRAGYLAPGTTPHRLKASLDDFELLRVIGRGAYGKVFLVRRREQVAHLTVKPSTSNVSTDLTASGLTSVTSPDPNRRLFAMKVLRKASIILHGKDTEHTQNERSILEAVRHPFIVKLFYAFQTREKLYLILGYASGGELFTHLAIERMFSEHVACFYLSELVLAIDHLHSLGIIYRDLKPENVLLDGDGHIVLTDFGLSKVAVDAMTVCGTIEFMAPEVLDERRAYGKAVDYWSLGVMLYDMLTGSPPFTGNNRKKVMEAIMKKKPVFPKFMTADARDLCNKLLKKQPEYRLGSGPDGSVQMKQHAFFRKVDWGAVLSKQVSPPFVPKLGAPEDTSYFHQEFTSMAVGGESPPSAPPGEGGIRLSQTDAFLGFSFVARHDAFPQRED